MTDRELLEDAARAAGLTLRDDFTALSVIRASSDGNWWPVWNPLTSDGDALRLAVALRITPHIDSNMTEAEAATRQAGGFFAEPHIDDPYAATRRAIVRAAAALAGKTP